MNTRSFIVVIPCLLAFLTFLAMKENSEDKIAPTKPEIKVPAETKTEDSPSESETESTIMKKIITSYEWGNDDSIVLIGQSDAAVTSSIQKKGFVSIPSTELHNSLLKFYTGIVTESGIHIKNGLVIIRRDTITGGTSVIVQDKQNLTQ